MSPVSLLAVTHEPSAAWTPCDHGVQDAAALGDFLSLGGSSSSSSSSSCPIVVSNSSRHHNASAFGAYFSQDDPPPPGSPPSHWQNFRYGRWDVIEKLAGFLQAHPDKFHRRLNFLHKTSKMHTVELPKLKKYFTEPEIQTAVHLARGRLRSQGIFVAHHQGSLQTIPPDFFQPVQVGSGPSSKKAMAFLDIEQAKGQVLVQSLDTNAQAHHGPTSFKERGPDDPHSGKQDKNAKDENIVVEWDTCPKKEDLSAADHLHETPYSKLFMYGIPAGLVGGAFVQLILRIQQNQNKAKGKDKDK